MGASYATEPAPIGANSIAQIGGTHAMPGVGCERGVFQLISKDLSK